MKFKLCTGPCGKNLPIHNFGIRKVKGNKYKHRARCNKCHTKLNLLSRKKCGRKTSQKTADRARVRASEYYYKVRGTKSFKAKASERASARRALKLKATPSWITEDQLEEIENFYWLTKDLQSLSGEVYHVDHIVPLKGKNVCGLHVPWNLQVLPADINLSKGNSYAEYA